MKDNPFIIKGYKSAELFCDRVKETEKILNLIQNSVDITLISPRKIGKTGLILHVFDQLERVEPEYVAVYADIYSSLNLNDFIKSLAEAILEKYPERTSIGKRFSKLIRSFRAILSFDALTGSPQLSFQFANSSEQEYSLRQILYFLDNQGSKVVLAIDEFQQITSYPEKNVEALLREQVQKMHNTSFIFCGSKPAMMREIFSSTNRPFFSSTRQVEIDRIDSGRYSEFIEDKFISAGRWIDHDAIDFVLQWTKRHTYYTQVVCNELFGRRGKKLTVDDVRSVCNEILDGESSTCLQYRSLLTVQQWRLLIGIAKEDEVSQISSSAFVSKYKIGNTTTSARAAEALVEKDMVLKTITKDKVTYQVYDLFFSRWLAREY